MLMGTIVSGKVMNFITVHSVGNGIIIPTVTHSIIFQRGWLRNHQPGYVVIIHIDQPTSAEVVCIRFLRDTSIDGHLPGGFAGEYGYGSNWVPQLPSGKLSVGP